MTAYLFDTETTGAKRPEIIEAAWIKLRSPDDLLVEGESVTQRFKPSKPIELGALAIHHILDEELEGCSPSSSFALPNDIVYMIGHNVDYDWEVSGQPDVKRICTLALSRRYVKTIDSHSQSALMYYFYRNQAKDRLKNAHSALADVENCLLILTRLIAIINENVPHAPIQSWEQLWEVSEAARIPTTISFGKHKGRLISSLPNDYKIWLLKQDGIDPYLKQAVNAYVS